jgi:multidrug efflux pump subunit AcrB
MRLTDFATHHRTSVLVLTVLLAVGGLYSYIVLPKESAPSIEVPYINVTTFYPGASPDDVAELITSEIEQELQSITGVKEIRSTSTEGLSSIVVEFLPDVPIDDAEQDVRDQVETAKSDLPDDAEDPVISEIDTSEFPIMTINLAADYSLTRLKELAEDLRDEIESRPGVLEVDISGGLEREVQVNVNLDKLLGYGLTFSDIADAIRNENTNIPGGSIDIAQQNYLLRVEGRFQRPEEIENFVVAAPNGVPIYVRDLAEVKFGFKDRESYALLKVMHREEDGELRELPDADYRQVIALDVKKRSGENILEVAAAVNEILDTYPLPAGTQVLITGDQSERVEDLVTDLENNVVAGIIFVVLVLLFFLGARNSMLVGLAIPMSMLTSFLVLLVMGYTLNFVILFSLIIALGMLVDNAIVIVENIYRFREEGCGRWEAARRGTGEVAIAVIASTATTVAAFAPMLFWPGLIGEFMSFLPMTLIVTLTCSLFVALIINPVIAGYLVRVENNGAVRGGDARGSHWVRIALALAAAIALALIAVVNPISALVVGVGGITLWLLHRWVLQPVADGFVSRGLPRLIARYRVFLGWMLQRDYSPKGAWLRNTGALFAFTVGVVLAIVGALIAAGIDRTAGMVVLVPAGVIAGLGALGIVLHALETLVLAVLSLFGQRPRLVLTDNRARLLTVVLASMFAVFALFSVTSVGQSFFPDTDPNQVRITLVAPEGTNLDTSELIAREAQRRIDELLDAHPASRANVESIQVNVGAGGDQGFGGGFRQAERSRLILNLVDFAERSEPGTATLERIRQGLRGIPGVDIEIDKDQQGPPTGAPVNIEVAGPDFNEAARIAGEIKRRLQRGVEEGAIQGLVDLNDSLQLGRPEIHVDIDRERAAQFGLSTRKIGDIVRSAVQGTEATTWRFEDDEYDVVVRLREEDRSSPESLESLTLREGGRGIPLVAIAQVEWTTGAGSVTHLDLDPVVTVTGNNAAGYTSQAVLAQVRSYLADYQRTLPPGYQMSYTGEQEEQQESFSFLTTALVIGSALIFFILIAQFNSVGQPILIMIAVGLGLVGVLVGLILTGTPFSLFTFIGVISLAGIIVNNNIVLVDYINQLRDRGMARREAIIEGGATRLRPVVLTALTTVIGLVPLTFGINVDFVGLLTRLEPNFQFGSQNTQFWGPMGIAIISGLTFGTFLTLVVVPVIYSVFDSIATRLTAAAREHEAEPVAAE